ncbi:MAG: M20 family metallo-hydrolase [Thermoleophilaceae bacterium]
MSYTPLRVDRAQSADRIERDVETLAGSAFTDSPTAICRYAYTDSYRRTVEYFADQLEELGFETSYDPVGTLVARNRPHGSPVFGMGSHCDSNRNGGKYDGTLGVACALEVCRLNREHGLDLPLQVISFLEEEGSGFGSMLLGSRVMAGRTTEEELLEGIVSSDDGEAFWTHAERAGHRPERWRESARALDDTIGWIELHIEQGRTLQDRGIQVGVVDAIAGYVHAEVSFEGRADHAGGTPMGTRSDAALAAAETMLAVERLAEDAGAGTVGTVGKLDLSPGLINVVPGGARLTIDVRGVERSAYRGVLDEVLSSAGRAADERSLRMESRERVEVPPTPLDESVVTALERAATAGGVTYTRMPSGAAHDTMFVAQRVPSAMVFVPCLDGISHSPLEDAGPADAAVGAELMLGAILEIVTDHTG